MNIISRIKDYFARNPIYISHKSFYKRLLTRGNKVQYHAIGITGLSKILKLTKRNNPEEAEELQRCFKDSRVMRWRLD